MSTETREKGLLSDGEILQEIASGDLQIGPLLDPKKQLQSSSIDVRLGTSFGTIRNAQLIYLNLLKEAREAQTDAARYIEKIHIGLNDFFVIHPGEFALGATFEYVKLPLYLSGRLEGKSTWGRLGLQVHSTAGFIDPGFQGCLTFELQNVGKAPIPLYPCTRIAQICFFRHSPALSSYGGEMSVDYSNSYGFQSSKFFKMPDWEIIRRLRDKQSI